MVKEKSPALIKAPHSTVSAPAGKTEPEVTPSDPKSPSPSSKASVPLSPQTSLAEDPCNEERKTMILKELNGLQDLQIVDEGSASPSIEQGMFSNLPPHLLFYIA